MLAAAALSLYCLEWPIDAVRQRLLQADGFATAGAAGTRRRRPLNARRALVSDLQ